MENTILFIDNGFFRLVKKEIEIKTKKKKKFFNLSQVSKGNRSVKYRVDKIYINKRIVQSIT